MSMVSNRTCHGLAVGDPRDGEHFAYFTTPMKVYEPGIRGLPRLGSDPMKMTIESILMGQYHFKDGLWFWEKIG